MPRRWLVAFVVCVIWTIAFGTACDSSQRRLDPARQTTAAAAQPARAATPPPVPARVAAIGFTAPLSNELQRAFDPTVFEPMPEPGPDDWLARHPERPQS